MAYVGTAARGAAAAPGRAARGPNLQGAAAMIAVAVAIPVVTAIFAAHSIGYASPAERRAASGEGAPPVIACAKTDSAGKSAIRVVDRASRCGPGEAAVAVRRLGPPPVAGPKSTT